MVLNMHDLGGGGSYIWRIIDAAAESLLKITEEVIA